MWKTINVFRAVNPIYGPCNCSNDSDWWKSAMILNSTVQWVGVMAPSVSFRFCKTLSKNFLFPCEVSTIEFESSSIQFEGFSIEFCYFSAYFCVFPKRLRRNILKNSLTPKKEIIFHKEIIEKETRNPRNKLRHGRAGRNPRTQKT